MIRHIVLFRARNSSDAEIIRDGLRNLQAIQDASLIEVEYNERIDSWSHEIDVVVYGEFEDEEALAKFKQNPIYEESIKIVKPLRDLRIAADYRVRD